MKKLITAILAVAMLISMTVPAFAAYRYSFDSGADYNDMLGKSTSTDNTVTQNPETENIRRNKDASYNPPSYGTGSGDIPTEQSSLYHDNSVSYSTISYSSSTGTFSGGVSYLPYLPNETTASLVQLPMTADTNYEIFPLNGSDYGGMLPPTSMYSPDTVNTLPLYYDDGSIGILSIPRLNLNVKVYEGESVDNMKVGVGHFEFTSAWSGNVGVAGHNRGAAAYFGGVKNLAAGDTITYSTKYGTRTYEVYYKEQITDTDYSNLGWSDVNIITLITCVENVPNMRWCVQAREVRH